MTVRTPDPNPGWLSDEEFAEARRRLPILYVEAVPITVDHLGQVTGVGTLLRANDDGALTRSIVSGRVMYGESVRAALERHLEKDLGPMAFAQMPVSPVPFQVAEYYPLPGGLYTDDRQHAVSLCFIVPVSGECQPRQDALELTWLTPDAAASELIAEEMEGGRGSLLRAALAHLGALR